jgi:hypothetical protein
MTVLLPAAARAELHPDPDNQYKGLRRTEFNFARLTTHPMGNGSPGKMESCPSEPLSSGRGRYFFFSL